MHAQLRRGKRRAEMRALLWISALSLFAAASGDWPSASPFCGKPEVVNDGFCDCADGSDEPLLASCPMPTASFQCVHTGFLNQTMLRSRVGDGICDCCDGSDESPIIGCPNTCEALQKAEQEKAVRHYQDIAQGLKGRQQMIDQAVRELEARSKSADELKKEHHALQQLLFKVKIRRHEEERLERQERYEYIRHAQFCSADETCPAPTQQPSDTSSTSASGGGSKTRTRTRQSKSAKAVAGALDRVMATVCNKLPDASTGDDGSLESSAPSKETLKDYLVHREAASKRKQSHKDLHKTTLMHRLITEGGFKTILQYFFELIGLLLTPLHGVTYVLGKAWHFTAAAMVGALRTCTSTCSPTMAGFARAALAELALNEANMLRHLEYRRYSLLRALVGAAQPAIEYVQWPFVTAWNAPWVYYLLYFPPQGPAYVRPEACLLREAESAIQVELKAISSRLQTMDKEDTDAVEAKEYGDDNVFLTLDGQCVNTTESEYTYKLCFFDSVKQNTIYLGRYKGWAEAKGGKDYTTQLYEKGQMCPGNEWRTATVHFQCGASTRIVKVAEPQRCTYQLDVETPAACTSTHFDEALAHLEGVGIAKNVQ